MPVTIFMSFILPKSFNKPNKKKLDSNSNPIMTWSKFVVFPQKDMSGYHQNIYDANI